MTTFIGVLQVHPIRAQKRALKGLAARYRGYEGAPGRKENK